MPPDYPREALLEKLRLQRTEQSSSQRHVINATVRLDLVEEPEALLRERERRHLRAEISAVVRERSPLHALLPEEQLEELSSLGVETGEFSMLITHPSPFPSDSLQAAF